MACPNLNNYFLDTVISRDTSSAIWCHEWRPKGMQCVILAGGFGTRISEESSLRPKPMIEIGDRPILWHIMKYYTHFGITDFIICLGYKGYVIKEYFANYQLHNADVTFDLAANEINYHSRRNEPWSVTLIDTGEASMTGGRLRRIRPYLSSNQPFCMTYGDGLSDIDVEAEIAFHKRHGLKATVACVRPPARFGRIVLIDDKVASFEEKPQAEGGLINGGFFILHPDTLDYVEGDSTVWEREPMERLADSGQLAAWRHQGFWQPMDTLRDKQQLTAMWESGKAPWKVWKD
jgi:glucose-1-phosphate cytidylyltransferase